MSSEELGRAIREVADEMTAMLERMRPTFEKLDRALTDAKAQRRQPPFWTVNPGLQRRRR